MRVLRSQHRKKKRGASECKYSYREKGDKQNHKQRTPKLQKSLELPKVEYFYYMEKQILHGFLQDRLLRFHHVHPLI